MFEFCRAVRVAPRLAVALLLFQFGVSCLGAAIRDGGIDPSNLCSTIRAHWANKFLAHSPFAIITYHSTFPYKEFGYYCDAVMPQDYWIEIGVTPTAMVTEVPNVAAGIPSADAVRTVLRPSPPRIDAITLVSGQGMQLQVSGGPRQFAIEVSPTLSAWTQLATLTATGSLFQIVDPETNQASRFYRVRALP